MMEAASTACAPGPPRPAGLAAGTWGHRKTMQTLLRRLGAGLTAVIGRLERRIGAERPGRSPWVWLGPAVNVVAPYVLFVGGFGQLDLFRELDLWTRLAIATVAAGILTGMSVAYLVAFGADAREAADL
jgi:hypothetical protein